MPVYHDTCTCDVKLAQHIDKVKCYAMICTYHNGKYIHYFQLIASNWTSHGQFHYLRYVHTNHVVRNIALCRDIAIIYH